MKFAGGMIALAALFALGGTHALAQEPVKLRIMGMPLSTGNILKNREQPYFEKLGQNVGFPIEADYKPLDSTGIKEFILLTAHEHDPSLTQLISNLLGDVRTLIRQEVALARAEFREELGRIIMMLVLLATAGGLVFAGEGNGWFKAYDAKTGTVLWKFYCGAGANAAPVTVSFRTTDGTARVSDGDYVAMTGTITFAPGETTKTITIEVKGDNKREADEYFYFDLFGNSSNSLFTKNRGIGTILNDD